MLAMPSAGSHIVEYGVQVVALLRNSLDLIDQQHDVLLVVIKVRRVPVSLRHMEEGI
jgi:ribosomal protein S4E